MTVMVGCSRVVTVLLAVTEACVSRQAVSTFSSRLSAMPRKCVTSDAKICSVLCASVYPQPHIISCTEYVEPAADTYCDMLVRCCIMWLAMCSRRLPQSMLSQQQVFVAQSVNLGIALTHANGQHRVLPHRQPAHLVSHVHAVRRTRCASCWFLRRMSAVAAAVSHRGQPRVQGEDVI